MAEPSPAPIRVRAPGRVNLIGEHTDYSHLPVLPIAIDRGLTVTVRPTTEPMVTARSTVFEGEVTVSRAELRLKGPSWGRYLVGIANELANVAPGLGAQIEIEGDLPAESGLSSSSALSVGVLAGLAASWGVTLSREDIAAKAIAAERHTGVETGGMDQAVIAFAKGGHALRIDFDPHARKHVAIPEGLAFVVANSGQAAAKGAEMRAAYNERVVGTRLAAALICDMVGIEAGVPPRLSDVAALSEAELLADMLPERSSPAAVAASTGILAESLGALTVGSINVREQVVVKRYARHVLAEAARVDSAEAALGAFDLAGFGRLLNESHESLRNDVKCSTPALDALCKAMRKAGAFGARVTGAGFGGYALSACPPERVEAVIATAVTATGGPAFEVTASHGYSFE